MACAGGGVYGQSLCQPFLSISVWVFPQWPMCTSGSCVGGGGKTDERTQDSPGEINIMHSIFL